MNHMTVEKFWERLDLAVKSKCKTYVALCELCDNQINLATIYNTRNAGRYLSIKYLAIICDALDVSLDWLVFGKEKNDYTDSELQSVRDYLKAPKAVKDIVDRILQGHST